MRGLQCGVGLVLRVTTTIVIDGANLESLMLTQRIHGTRVLIDVVTQMRHEVEIFLRHMLEGGKESLIPTLATRDGQSQWCHRTICGRRAEFAGLACRLVHLKAIEVPTIGREPVHVHMHTVRKFLSRSRATALHDPLEAVIVSHFPNDHGTIAHAPIWLERPRRESRPQHAAGGGGIAGRDAQGERIINEARAGRHAPDVGDDGAQGGGARHIGKKVSAVHSAYPTA